MFRSTDEQKKNNAEYKKIKDLRITNRIEPAICWNNGDEENDPYNLLHWATLYHQVDEVTALVNDHKAILNQPSKRNELSSMQETNVTALFIAAREGYVDLVKFFLNKNANSMIRAASYVATYFSSVHHTYPIEAASSRGHHYIVMLLAIPTLEAYIRSRNAKPEYLTTRFSFGVGFSKNAKTTDAQALVDLLKDQKEFSLEKLEAIKKEHPGLANGRLKNIYNAIVTAHTVNAKEKMSYGAGPGGSDVNAGAAAAAPQSTRLVTSL